MAQGLGRTDALHANPTQPVIGPEGPFWTDFLCSAQPCHNMYKAGSVTSLRSPGSNSFVERIILPIARDGGFLRWTDAPHRTGVGIESDKLPECIREIKDTGLKGAFGSPSFGFAEQDLDFLREIPFVESVWFWDVALKNIDGLYALANLRHFGVHPGRPAIRFDQFPHLQTAVVELRTKDSGLARLQSLQTLHLWRYKEKSLSSLALPDSLVELQLNWASASSLDHLQALPNLRRLEIHRCSHLESLGVLCEKYPNLEHLVVAACGRMSADEGSRAIRGLTKLKHAFVQTFVLVSSSSSAWST